MLCHDCPADITTQDGALHCEHCVTENHTQCAGCDEWHPFDEGCDSCLDCYYCDRPTPPDDCTTTVDDDDICASCRPQHYWQCADCAGWNSDGEDHCRNGCRPENSCTCDDCIDYHPLIHDYDYRPLPDFHGTGPLYLGAEIEIHTPYGSRDVCAQVALSHLEDLGYLKEDESIGGGFEIVTHPMSYDWALANFPWTMLDQLRRNGCSTSLSTGLHVHVSRAGFTSACHTFRWMKFIYRNRHHVTRIARRESQQWAAFADKDRRAVKDYAKGAHGERRYAAINTLNAHTFELRVFASSLHIGEVQAALALAAASIEYTRTLSVAQVAAGGWQWPAFANWVARHPQYQPLRQQMEVMGCAC